MSKSLKASQHHWNREFRQGIMRKGFLLILISLSLEWIELSQATETLGRASWLPDTLGGHGTLVAAVSGSKEVAPLTALKGIPKVMLSIQFIILGRQRLAFSHFHSNPQASLGVLLFPARLPLQIAIVCTYCTECWRNVEKEFVLGMVSAVTPMKEN